MKKIVLAVCLSLIFALFWLWVYYIKYPVREPGLKELLLANSGRVYLAEDFDRDSDQLNNKKHNIEKIDQYYQD